MSRKKTRKLTRKQEKLVEGIVAGKSHTQAAIDAGYSPNNPRQSAYQAIAAIEERARHAFDRKGITLDNLIDKHLLPLLQAKEIKHFPWRQTITVKSSPRGKKSQEREEIHTKVVQRIDTRTVAALSIRLAALDMVFRLRGDFPPKQIDTEPQATGELHVYLGDIPRFNDNAPLRP